MNTSSISGSAESTMLRHTLKTLVFLSQTIKNKKVLIQKHAELRTVNEEMYIRANRVLSAHKYAAIHNISPEEAYTEMESASLFTE
jgi:hypothetical protein